jgi:hypothetical protein
MVIVAEFGFYLLFGALLLCGPHLQALGAFCPYYYIEKGWGERCPLIMNLDGSKGLDGALGKK